VEIGTEAAAQFPEKEYINGIFVAVRMLFSPHGTRMKRPVFCSDCLPFLLLSFSSLCEAIEACPYIPAGGRVGANSEASQKNLYEFED
jgi:hypothetical protein